MSRFWEIRSIEGWWPCLHIDFERRFDPPKGCCHQSQINATGRGDQCWVPGSIQFFKFPHKPPRDLQIGRERTCATLTWRPALLEWLCCFLDPSMPTLPPDDFPPEDFPFPPAIVDSYQLSFWVLGFEFCRWKIDVIAMARKVMLMFGEEARWCEGMRLSH